MKDQKHPGIYWFPGDWRKDPGVQSLSFEERGIWFEILMLMAESSDRGKLTLNGRKMTDEEGSKILGLNEAKFKQTVKQIVDKGVASIEAKTEILFNRRMVREAELHKIRAEAGRLGGKHSGEIRRSKIETKTNIPNLTLSNLPLKHTSKPSCSTPLNGEAFDRFWKAYPKRKAKAAAIKAFKKINPDRALLDTILAAVEKNKTTEQWSKDDGQFIPLPASWLNGRRWEDEISTGGNRGNVSRGVGIIVAPPGKYERFDKTEKTPSAAGSAI